MRILRSSATIKAAVAAVLGALLATSAAAGPSAAAPKTAAVQKDQLRTDLTAGPESAVRYTRTSGYITADYQITFWQGPVLVGTLSGTYVESERLNVKSNTWKRQWTIKATSATGVAQGGVTSLVKVSCGRGSSACTSTGPQTKHVRAGQSVTFGFNITSRGSKILTHKPVLNVTTTAPGYSPAVGNVAAMRTVRCDSEKITNGGRRGCVYPSVVPNFSLSRTSRVWGEMARHVYAAERTLNGQPGYARPLHRTTSDQGTRNRRRSCPSRLHRPRGKECDEYPYASVQEGGGNKGLGKKCNTIDPNATQSCRMIDADDNHKGGGQLTKFYNDNRIIAYRSGSKIIGDAFFSRVP
ncbi:NucA/NucB deoxyribonuclease domain-containing protein [Streptomyces sp. N2A]|uniref:NucA/NucB deoxyribonuclease domain-containing protein n=1 Tax=Streptomyces sp. N2A TaxID=3073936 RepID=UPI00287091A5|nr:NucA/NucB deoxyribonuclease domain-containing protein [Streptomyces sp. N2A]